MSHVVSIGKTKLQAGLYWSRLQSPHKKRKIIKEEMRGLVSEYKQVFSEEPSVGVLHSNGIDLLMGVGEPAENAGRGGKKEKLHSLVCLALLANPTARSFVGRLRLSEDCDWVAVVRSGVVSPVGDLAVSVGETDEAFATIRERNEGLEVLFNEQDVDASIRLIEGWLESVSTRKISLVKDVKDLGAPPLGGRQIAVYGVLASIVLGSAYIGYSQYQAHVERLEAKAEAERRAALERINNRGAIPTPWVEWPRVSDVAGACLSNHYERDDYRYGWNEVYWSCNGQSVTQNWQRSEIGSYTYLPVSDGFNLTRPNEISHQESLDTSLEPRGGQGVAAKADVAKILMDAARQNGMAIRLEWGQEETRSYMQGDRTVTEGLGYSFNSGTISSRDLSGVAIIEILNRIPGLRLSRISQDRQGFEIKIEFYTAV